MKVWYFSCHGISHSRNTDKLEEARTVVMVGFGPMSGANWAYIIMCLYATYVYHAWLAKVSCGRPQTHRMCYCWATTIGISNMIHVTGVAQLLITMARMCAVVWKNNYGRLSPLPTLAALMRWNGTLLDNHPFESPSHAHDFTTTAHYVVHIMDGAHNLNTTLMLKIAIV